MLQLHPCLNDDGEPVVIRSPSSPTSLASWQDTSRLATAIPAGALPDAINGIQIAPWMDAPGNAAGWARLGDRAPVDEPPFVPPPGMAAAAGVVILEDDGRVWLVAPSNKFGGYSATFPKGRVDSSASLHCTAIREAFEESGLQVGLVAFLTDSSRTLTYTRYYIARRIGGTPAAMGWETQAVHLVPLTQLDRVANHQNDYPVIKALREWLKSQG